MGLSVCHEMHRHQTQAEQSPHQILTGKPKLGPSLTPWDPAAAGTYAAKHGYTCAAKMAKMEHPLSPEIQWPIPRISGWALESIRIFEYIWFLGLILRYDSIDFWDIFSIRSDPVWLVIEIVTLGVNLGSSASHWRGIPWHGQIWSCAAVTCYKNVTRTHLMWVDVGFSVVESDCFVCHFCYERGKPNTFPCLWILWPWRHLHGGSWMVLLDSQHVS